MDKGEANLGYVVGQPRKEGLMAVTDDVVLTQSWAFCGRSGAVCHKQSNLEGLRWASRL